MKINLYVVLMSFEKTMLFSVIFQQGYFVFCFFVFALKSQDMRSIYCQLKINSI